MLALGVKKLPQWFKITAV